jgi:hypothetical protein
LEFGGCWKALGEFRLSGVYFTIFRAKVWKIMSFLVNFVAENSKKIVKFGFGRKN